MSRGSARKRRALIDEHLRGGDLDPSAAQRVAEAVSLAELLETDPGSWRSGVRLLMRMSRFHHRQVPLLAYPGAVRAVRAAFRNAPPGPPVPEPLADLAEELLSGYAALLDWPAGERRDLLAQVFDEPVLTDGLAVRFVARDTVEVRILADGRPVIAEAFSAGPATSPSRMFGREPLRATTEPHGLCLADAWCGSGCCAITLDVWIVREGDTVIWRDWSGCTSPQPPPELRFDAAQYDRELARASTDLSWEWPARTVERLVRRDLSERRDAFTRWECEFSGLYARPRDREHVELRFFHPRSPRGDDRSWVDLRRILPVTWADPAEVAARILHDLETTDPKAGAEVVRGDPDLARSLGRPAQ